MGTRAHVNFMYMIMMKLFLAVVSTNISFLLTHTKPNNNFQNRKNRLSQAVFYGWRDGRGVSLLSYKNHDISNKKI